MKLTKQDLLRLPKERLAEIIVEMQEKETLTLTTPEKDFNVSNSPVNYCVWYGGVCPYTYTERSCLTCPHKQVTATIFKAEDIQKYVDAIVGSKNTSATDRKKHPNSFVE